MDPKLRKTLKILSTQSLLIAMIGVTLIKMTEFSAYKINGVGKVFLIS